MKKQEAIAEVKTVEWALEAECWECLIERIKALPQEQRNDVRLVQRMDDFINRVAPPA